MFLTYIVVGIAALTASAAPVHVPTDALAINHGTVLGENSGRRTPGNGLKVSSGDTKASNNGEQSPANWKNVAGIDFGFEERSPVSKHLYASPPTADLGAIPVSVAPNGIIVPGPVDASATTASAGLPQDGHFDNLESRRFIKPHKVGDSLGRLEASKTDKLLGKRGPAVTTVLIPKPLFPSIRIPPGENNISAWFPDGFTEAFGIITKEPAKKESRDLKPNDQQVEAKKVTVTKVEPEENSIDGGLVLDLEKSLDKTLKSDMEFVDYVLAHEYKTLLNSRERCRLYNRVFRNATPFVRTYAARRMDLRPSTCGNLRKPLPAPPAVSSDLKVSNA